MNHSLEQKKLLILGDRFARRQSLINLGEGAKWEGLYQLVKGFLDFEILSGPWKCFPYFRMGKLRKSISNGGIEKEFAEILDKTDSFSSRRINLEKGIFHFFQEHDLSDYSWSQRFNKKFERRFNRSLKETLLPYFLRAHYFHHLSSLMREADLVLFQSDVFADHVKQYFPSFVLEILMAKKFRKKVVSINQTVDISDPCGLEMAALALKNIDLHLLREPISREFLLRLGVEESKIVVTADSAFAIDIPDEMSPAEKKGIGLFIRGDRPVNVEFWIQIIHILNEKYKRKVFLIFTCKPQDEWVFKKLKGRCSLHRLQEEYGYMDLIRVLKQMDFVITDRFHAAVFSIMANTPVIPFEAKSHKMEGLFSMFDYPIKVLKRDLHNDEKSLLERVEIVLNRSGEVREKLSSAGKILKDSARNGMKAVQNFYERHCLS